MTDGIVFVVCGDKAEMQYKAALQALEVSGNTLPTQRVGRDYAAANKQASRMAKTTLFGHAGFDRYLYMDADTRARESLRPFFDILDDGWDVVMAVDGNQDESVFWHVNCFEKQSTLEEIGVMPLQLQCGIMAVSKNERTQRLFDAWHSEWNRYSGEDQAAFIRALYRAPVKVWLMGYPWNGGAAIGHNWGAMR